MSANDHDYVWDRSGPADPVVERLERTLAGHAFDATRCPLVLPGRRHGTWAPRALAAAAVLVLLASGLAGAYRWRFSWTSGAPWPVSVPGAPSGSGALRVGEPFRYDGEAPATARLARIGRVSIAPSTDLTLTQTSGVRHVLTLSRGRIGVRAWAPPFVVMVRTPAGVVMDLGCAFELDVDDAGVARVVVTSGSVEIENAHGSMRVPEGARAQMSASAPPLVPVYLDASDRFRDSVRAIEQGAVAAAAAGLTDARPRDVMTLLALASRQSGNDRAVIVGLAATLWPPPAGVDPAGVAAGDQAALWRWHDALPLPPPKQWWRNWRDAFPE